MRFVISFSCLKFAWEESIYIIGIAGRTGSGKSTAAKIISEEIGDCRLIDADGLAKGIYARGGEILKDIRDTFGNDVFEGQKLCREALAKKVFSSLSELKKLNRLMFPLIRAEVKAQIKRNSSVSCIILDAAVLFSSKLDLLCDYIIWVKADKKVRKGLLLLRGIPEKEADLKIKGQKIAINHSRVDYKIVNDGSMQDFELKCRRAAEDIISRNRGKYGKQV